MRPWGPERLGGPDGPGVPDGAGASRRPAGRQAVDSPLLINHTLDRARPPPALPASIQSAFTWRPGGRAGRHPWRRPSTAPVPLRAPAAPSRDDAKPQPPSGKNSIESCRTRWSVSPPCRLAKTRGRPWAGHGLFSGQPWPGVGLGWPATESSQRAGRPGRTLAAARGPAFLRAAR